MLAISLHQDSLFLTGDRYFVGLVTQSAETFVPADPAISSLAVATKTAGAAGEQPARTIRRQELPPTAEFGAGTMTIVSSRDNLSEKSQTLPVSVRAREGGRKLLPEKNETFLRQDLSAAGEGSSPPISVASKNSHPAAMSQIAQTTRAKPRYADNPYPVYPAVARRKGWSGKVLLLVQVDNAGFVKRLSVNRSSGYRVLDRAAHRAVRRWRFIPATEAGRSIASEVVVPVDFRLPDNAAATAGSFPAGLK